MTLKLTNRNLQLQNVIIIIENTWPLLNVFKGRENIFFIDKCNHAFNFSDFKCHYWADKSESEVLIQNLFHIFQVNYDSKGDVFFSFIPIYSN